MGVFKLRKKPRIVDPWERVLMNLAQAGGQGAMQFGIQNYLQNQRLNAQKDMWDKRLAAEKDIHGPTGGDPVSGRALEGLSAVDPAEGAHMRAVGAGAYRTPEERGEPTEHPWKNAPTGMILGQGGQAPYVDPSSRKHLLPRSAASMQKQVESLGPDKKKIFDMTQWPKQVLRSKTQEDMTRLVQGETSGRQQNKLLHDVEQKFPHQEHMQEQKFGLMGDYQKNVLAPLKLRSMKKQYEYDKSLQGAAQRSKARAGAIPSLPAQIKGEDPTAKSDLEEMNQILSSDPGWEVHIQKAVNDLGLSREDAMIEVLRQKRIKESGGQQ